MEDNFKLDRVSITNFRSIGHCDVDLCDLTFFVGPNASGKTNFVDALSFIAQALQTTLEGAVRTRDGFLTILHAPVSDVGMEFVFQFSSSLGIRGRYLVRLRPIEGLLSVVSEECHITETNGHAHHFQVENGTAQGTSRVLPSVSRDRLFLVSASGLPEFRPAYDFLSGFRRTESNSSGTFVLVHQAPYGKETLASRLHRLEQRYPNRLKQIEEYLGALAPPFIAFRFFKDRNDGIQLRFEEEGLSQTWSGFMSQASTGTLNAAEILLQLFDAPEEGQPAAVVIIEEPEAFLHPAAISVLLDAFLEASRHRQLLVTSHSPDLLDDPRISGECIRSVYRDVSGTRIDPLDDHTRSILQDRLFTPGELLRTGVLTR